MNRPLSTKTHIAMDLAMYSALLLSPLYLPKSERRFAAFPMLLGAAGLLSALLTQTASGPEHLGFIPTREMSEAVADPDNARTPHVRAYPE